MPMAEGVRAAMSGDWDVHGFRINLTKLNRKMERNAKRDRGKLF